MSLKRVKDFPAEAAMWPPREITELLSTSGCHLDDEGQLARDRAIFGTAFVDGATGKRIDPSTVRPSDG